jgi:hypothetical protein
MKKTTYLMAFVLLMSLFSCAVFPSVAPPPSATPSGPRTIVLGDEAFTEEDVGGFISWYCQDFVDGGRILVEVGFFGDTSLEELGFILYDGGYSGELAYYHRTGLEHRWDWGPNGADYAFVIKPDGTGLYYDFSSVPYGENTKASDVYQCHQR